MFGQRGLEIEALKNEIARWQRDYVKLENEHRELSSVYAEMERNITGTRKSLVLEIEARIASEDATNILASVLCDLVRKKRSKKR